MLTLEPSPTDVGTYHLTLVASDGLMETTRSLTVTVPPDPSTTTRISGRVLSTDGLPLAGVPVAAGSASVRTGADGSFLLDLGAGAPSAASLTVSGDQYQG